MTKKEQNSVLKKKLLIKIFPYDPAQGVNLTSPISSMMLSNDAKTAFVLSLNENSKIVLQTLDISDINKIKECQATVFNHTATYQPIFMEKTPGNLFLLILFKDKHRATLSDMLIYDTKGQHLVESKRIFIKNAFSVFFTEDYRRVIIGGPAKLEIAELYMSYPNKHAFSASKNILKEFDVDFNPLRAEYIDRDDSLEI